MNRQIDNVADYVRSFEAQGDIRLFYKTWVWQRKAAEIQRRDRHRCVRCWRNGIYKNGVLVGFYRKSDLVHHKKHLREHPELALTDDNLESLCEECHRQEHPELYSDVKFPERWD